MAIDKLIKYDPKVLDLQLDEESFGRLASAVGALEQKVASGPHPSQILSLQEARDTLIDAGHDITIIDKAITMGLYNAPYLSHLEYNDQKMEIYAKISGFLKNVIRTLPGFCTSEYFDDQERGTFRQYLAVIGKSVYSGLVKQNEKGGDCEHHSYKIQAHDGLFRFKVKIEVPGYWGNNLRDYIMNHSTNQEIGHFILKRICKLPDLVDEEVARRKNELLLLNE